MTTDSMREAFEDHHVTVFGVMPTDSAESPCEPRCDLEAGYQAALSSPEVKALVKAASAIRDICGSDLETHFGKKYGGNFRKALKPFTGGK